MIEVRLPKVIENHLANSNRKDAVDVTIDFTHDATVIDDGKTYRGLDQIKQWRMKANKYNFDIEVVGIILEQDIYLVKTWLTGNFSPPNPMKLTFHFKLAEEKITYLHIE